MKLALIPPAGYESWIAQSNVHLMLPNVVHNNYLAAYSNARKRGEYIILDNGAAEGTLYRGIPLMTVARMASASEIVLPDILHDPRATTELIKDFFKVVDKVPPNLERYLEDVKFMAVAHGNTRAAVEAFIEDLYMQERVSVIGLPRYLVEVLNQSSRIDIANGIQEKFGNRYQVHLLGANGSWPLEFMAAAKYAPHIRSCDTSLPFYYAMQNCRLNVAQPATLRRPTDYFTRKVTIDEVTLQINISTMLGWMNAKAPVS